MPSSQSVSVHIFLRHLLYAVSHGTVVVGRGDDQIRPNNSAFGVHLVVMNQNAARCLNGGDAFGATPLLAGVHRREVSGGPHASFDPSLILGGPGAGRRVR